MFTPQRKAPWTPKSTTSKGKSVAYLDTPRPPPLSSLASPELGGKGAAMAGNVDDWRRFKEAGLLDESSLERKDREALIQNISRLEKELFDYQYNMGLLLIEKNNLVSKNEELGQEVAEAREIIKREQAAHIIAISEAEKREENLKKALDIERKSLVDLEQALRDMREEHSKLKGTSEATVADANSRIEDLEKKRLEIEWQSHSVNAKLVEADRKTSELDRKLQDLEARDGILKREHLTLTRERETQMSYFKKQKENLLEWERKLQEAEQRLCDSRRILNDREEKLHKTDMICKGKKSKLENLQQKIDLANATLKKMEEEMKIQSSALDLKEKEFEAVKYDLQQREKQLNEKDERLNARETMELQELLNEHKAKLDDKMHELDLEMKQKRKSLEEEFESRRQMLEQKETEANHLEVKLGKREQALEKKAERLKEKDNDVELKAKALKEQEKCVKAEEKKLEVEKKLLNTEKERQEKLKTEIEMLRTDLMKHQTQINEKRAKLEDVEKERAEYLRLQSNLKQEMTSVRHQSQLIEKEAADLKMETEKFERDWEALDEKRATVDNDLKQLAEEKVNFEKLRNSEEERLRNKKVEIEEYIRKETENIRLAKESFEATMKHEELMLSRKVENEHSLMLQDYEQRRQNLQCDMQMKQKEWEKMVMEKERIFEEIRLTEMRNISHLKEEAERKMQEMVTVRQHMENERKELEQSKKQLEETSTGMYTDIEALENLSAMLKNQREQLIRERELFSAFVEKIRSCKNCGDSALEFVHHDAQLPSVMGSSHLLRHSRLKDANNELSPFGDSSEKTLTVVNKGSSEMGGQKSILRKCASIIFSLSPNKGNLRADDEAPGSSALFVNGNEGAGTSQAHTCTNDEQGPAFGIDNDSLKNSQSASIVGVHNLDNAPLVDDSNIACEVQGILDPKKPDLQSGARKSGRRLGFEGRRTRSVKAVVEEAKAILGDSLEGKEVEQKNDSTPANANCVEKPLDGDVTLASNVRKRGRSHTSRMSESEQEVDDSEGKSDSVATGGRRKRRQTVASALSTPGQRRYNLRRHTTAGKAKEDDKLPLDGTAQPLPSLHEAPPQSLDVTIESSRRMNDPTSRSVEFSSEKIVRFDTTATLVDSNLNAAKSVENTLSEEAKSDENKLSEEVNGTSENVGEDDDESVFHDNEDVDGGDIREDDYGDDGEDDEDEDDDDDNPGQASVGKKIWKFFTT